MQASELRPDLNIAPLDPRSHKALAESLTDIPLFSDLDPRELDTLARAMREADVAPEGLIFQEGDPGHFLALILVGKVGISKSCDLEGTRSLGFAGPGKTIGEMALIDGEPRSATCRSLTECRLALLTADAFQKLSQSAPLLGFKVMGRLAKMLSQRLRQTTGQLIDRL